MLNVARINPFAATLGASSNLRQQVSRLRDNNQGVSVEDALKAIIAQQAVEEKEEEQKADIVIE